MADVAGDNVSDNGMLSQKHYHRLHREFYFHSSFVLSLIQNRICLIFMYRTHQHPVMPRALDPRPVLKFASGTPSQHGNGILALIRYVT